MWCSQGLVPFFVNCTGCTGAVTFCIGICAKSSTTTSTPSTKTSSALRPKPAVVSILVRPLGAEWVAKISMSAWRKYAYFGRHEQNGGKNCTKEHGHESPNRDKKKRKGVSCCIFYKGGRKTRVLSEDLLLAVGLGYAQSVLNLWHHFMPLHATSLQSCAVSGLGICMILANKAECTMKSSKLHQSIRKVTICLKKVKILKLFHAWFFFDFSHLSSWPLLFLQRIWLQTAEELAETWRFDVRVSRKLTPSVSNTRCDTNVTKNDQFSIAEQVQTFPLLSSYVDIMM